MFDPREFMSRDAKVIGERAPGEPRVGVVLGSGLGAFVDGLRDPVAIPFEDLPGFQEPTVAGHSGRMVRGSLHGVEVVVQQGRFHLYEGYSPQQVAYPIRVMAALGVTTLVITNAAGGLHGDWPPGSLMLISDHLNFQFRSTLRGRGAWVDESRFVDLSAPFSPRLMELCRRRALDLGIPLRSGVYCGVMGPAYETPAEVRVIRRLGADAVGMSTVAEVITAAHCGLEVLGLTCIANPATGLSRVPLGHDDVLKAVAEARRPFAALLGAVINPQA